MGSSSARDQAIDVYSEVAERYPRSEYAPKALASKAALEEAGKVRVTSEEFGKRVPAAFLTSIVLTEKYPSDAAAERAFWIVGSEYEDLKLWSRAADAFAQLGRRFPRTELDAWWKAGQVYDRRLDDAQRALDAYNRVPTSSPQYDEAQKRIKKLTK